MSLKQKNEISSCAGREFKNVFTKILFPYKKCWGKDKWNIHREAKVSTAPGIVLPQGEGSKASSKGEAGGPGEEETSKYSPQDKTTALTGLAYSHSLPETEISPKIRSAVERNTAAHVTLGCVQAPPWQETFQMV